ncbi:DUF7305 domain-containing protein [Lysinibacillus sphaericus]|uniref:DUF7305 domain-containing protein n=1 Tax=Lysinibacillus sphaericus TaxID=1421 RepID=UPI003CFF8A79
MNKWQKFRLNEDGFSFLLVFLAIILVTILGLGLLVISSNSLKTSTHERENQSIFYIAEAGINYEKAKLYEKANDAYQLAKKDYNSLPVNQKTTSKFTALYESHILALMEPLIQAEPTIIDTFETQLGKQPIAEITIDQDPDNHLRFSITSTGYFSDTPSQNREVIQTIDFVLKAETTNNNTGDGNGNINTITPEFTVQTQGNITLTGSATIKGNVATDTGIISIDGGSSITGTVGASSDNFIYPSWMGNLKDKLTQSSNYPGASILPPFPDDKMQQLSTLPVPANQEVVKDPYNKIQIINNGDFLADNWMTNNFILHLTDDTHFKQFKVDQNNTLTINVGNTDKNLYIEDLSILQGHVNIIGSGRLNIFVNNKFNLKGSLNKNGNANQVNLFYNGSSAITIGGETQTAASLYSKQADLTFTGGIGITGNIYTGSDNVTFNGGTNANGQYIIAPNATVTLEGGAHIKGAILADNLIANGGTSVTFTESTVTPPSSGYPEFGDPISLIKENELLEK